MPQSLNPPMSLLQEIQATLDALAIAVANTEAKVALGGPVKRALNDDDGHHSDRRCAAHGHFLWVGAREHTTRGGRRMLPAVDRKEVAPESRGKRQLRSCK